MDDPVLPSGTPLLESTLDKSLSTSQANLTRFLQTHLLRKWSLDACALPVSAQVEAAAPLCKKSSDSSDLHLEGTKKSAQVFS